MFGQKGLLITAIEAPYKVVEFTGETLFGKDEPRTRTVYREAPPQKQVCPVCGGRREVPSGFYDGVPKTNTHEMCRTCKGEGVI